MIRTDFFIFSPIGIAAVLMVKSGGGPLAVVDFILQRFFVKLYTETGFCRYIDVAVFDHKGLGDIAYAKVGLVGVAGVLLNKEVGNTGVKLNAGSQGDGSQGVVGSYGAVVHFHHCRKLSALVNTAYMADIGLNDADSLFFDQFSVLPFAEESFTCGDGYGGLVGNVNHAVYIFGKAGLFYEHGAVGL